MSRPQLKTDTSLWPGVAALGLFGVLAVTFLGADLPDPAGFGANAAMMKSIGAAMFGLEASALVGDGATAVDADSFLVVFEIIDLVLVGALVGAIMLARREENGENVSVTSTTDSDSTAVAADGGPGGADE